MVWLGACSPGLTPLVIWDKTSANHHVYIKEVLPVALKFGNKMLADNWIYTNKTELHHILKHGVHTLYPKNIDGTNLNPLDYCIWNELVEAMDWSRIKTKLTFIEELKRSIKKVKP